MPVMIAACSLPGSPPPGAAAAAARTAQAASILPAVQNMLLAITALGLGSVLTTLWKEEDAKVNQILGLPEGAEVHAILPIGWRGGLRPQPPPGGRRSHVPRPLGQRVVMLIR